jgi:hypothetical protein
MWANNETGVIQPIAALAEIAAERGVPFHTGAAQVLGRVPVDVASAPIGFRLAVRAQARRAAGHRRALVSRARRYHTAARRRSAGATPARGDRERDHRGGLRSRVRRGRG